MVEAEKALLDRFYQEFWVFGILLLISLIILICLTVFYLVKFKTLGFTTKLIILAVIVPLILLSISYAILFSRYCADYAYLKSNGPIKIEGTVIEFTRAVGDELSVTYINPLILIQGTNDKVILCPYREAAEKLNIGQTYTFVYLPNTKMAEVVNLDVT